MSLRRDFRRWNRSRSKYEKALRAYQFGETERMIKKSMYAFLTQFGSISLSKQSKKAIQEWMTALIRQEITQSVSFQFTENPDPDKDIRDAINTNNKDSIINSDRLSNRINYWLYYAINLDKDNSTQKLIEMGADVDARDDKGDTTLHLAVQRNNLYIVNLLLDNKQYLINVKNSHGKTPLHIAVENQKLEMVNLLLDNKGADVNATNKDGDTPLDVALTLDNNEVRQAIYEKVNKTNVMLEAIKNDKPVMLKYLLEQGADVNATNGHTPLHIAVEYENLDMVQLLLNKNANINATNKDGDTPLHIAVENENLDMIPLLLEKGANVNAENKDGYTPLHIADEDENLDMIQLLNQTAVP